MRTRVDANPHNVWTCT